MQAKLESSPIDIRSQIRIQTLEMMISRLRIANYGNLLLVIAVAGFLWNRVSQEFLIIWMAVNFVLTFGRAHFIYRRFQRTHIDANNVDKWLKLFCVSLFITNVIWGVAFPEFIQPDSPFHLVIVMFAFFTIIASGAASLSIYMPAFFSHGTPLVAILLAYFFIVNENDYGAYGVSVLLYYIVAAMFARSSNKDMQALIRLQIEKQYIAAELEVKKELAEQASLEKDRFLAAASHDLRQPLHSAGLLLSSLSRYVKGGPATEILTDISSAIKALNQSFGTLLDLSKLDAGVVNPNLQHFGIGNLLQKIAKEYAPSAALKGIGLKIESSECTINSDKLLTERIVRNLVSNSVRYTDAGEVSLSAETHGDIVRICVKDTGAGIAEDQQQAIFSEYYQINNPERDRSQGFGLGLSIVKRLVVLLGGSVQLESELGVGSAFSVELPAGQAEKVVAARVQIADVGNFSGLNVLVIDDDKGVRKAIRTVVEAWGCEVLAADSAAEAIAKIDERAFLPKLILADYRLRNNATGVEAIEAVRDELNSLTPAIIITGDTSASRIVQASESGFQLLHKPVSPAVLRSAMQKAVRLTVQN